MKGDAAGKPAAPGDGLPKLSKGFQTLTRPEAVQPPALPAKKTLLPPWFFFSADLLLLAFTVAIVFNAPKPLAWEDWVFCIITTGVAGVFGLIGLMISMQQRGQAEKEKKAGHMGHGGDHDARGQRRIDF